MKALTEDQIAETLQQEPLWRLAGGKLSREWTFPDFVAAVAFVNRVAAIAEEAAHHPDIDIRYNKVTLALVTHDAGGITANDVAMASRLSREFPA
jgi:4a-hydroxytetrahydrobiopterin dehydratase